MSMWMVVEDEPDLYQTLLALFDLWSVDGLTFTTGTDALQWIEDVDAGRIAPSVPKLALLDVRLPGISGDQVGNRLRRSPVLKNIAIILTASNTLSPEGEREALKTAQADQLVYKPLPEPQTLQALLTSAVNGRS